MELSKNGNCKRKSRVQKLAYCTLRDLVAKLDVHGRDCMLYILVHCLFQFYVVNFTIEQTNDMMLLYLQDVILNMLFVQSLIPKLII